MSKVFIPTANCGRAHEADIFGMVVCNPFTATCSGDGTIKLWQNKLLAGEIAKLKFVQQFVNKTGVHHIDVLHVVERGGVEICVIVCAAFDGSLTFYSVDLATMKLTGLDLLSEADKKRSYWCVKWLKSDDANVTHKLAATEVNGSTRVWRFHPFKKEIEETVQNNKIDGNKSDEGVETDCLDLHLTLHGEFVPPTAKFATAIDISAENLIATGYSDGSVIILQVNTMRSLYTFEGFGLQGTQENSSTVRSLKFSPLGGLLAVGHDSGSYGCITLYDVQYGEAVGTLSVPAHSAQRSVVSVAHNGWVFGLSFNSTGEYLASCGYDAKIRIWDVKQREHLSTLHLSAGDIDDEEDIVQMDEHGMSLASPPVLGVSFISKGVRTGQGSDLSEGLCCICLDRSIRWYKEAGGV